MLCCELNTDENLGEKKAMDNRPCTLKKGRSDGFIGHNGAGKTTTIKACCGILQFEDGEIYVDGISVKDNPLACKGKLAYLPDNPESL